MPNYEAKITVSRTYTIGIQADDEDRAEDIGYWTDTMFLHKFGQLEDVEVEYVEVRESEDYPIQIRLEQPDLDLSECYYHLEPSPAGPVLVFSEADWEPSKKDWSQKLQEAEGWNEASSPDHPQGQTPPPREMSQ